MYSISFIIKTSVQWCTPLNVKDIKSQVNSSALHENIFQRHTSALLMTTHNQFPYTAPFFQRTIHSHSISLEHMRVCVCTRASFCFCNEPCNRKWTMWLGNRFSCSSLIKTLNEQKGWGHLTFRSNVINRFSHTWTYALKGWKLLNLDGNLSWLLMQANGFYTCKTLLQLTVL